MRCALDRGRLEVIECHCRHLIFLLLSGVFGGMPTAGKVCGCGGGYLRWVGRMRDIGKAFVVFCLAWGGFGWVGDNCVSLWSDVQEWTERCRGVA